MIWPFNSKKDVIKKTESKNQDIEIIDSELLQIDSIDFYGTFTKSKDGRYILGWDYQTYYVLLFNLEIILKGKKTHLVDGHVANNGTFILNDNMSRENTESTFYAIDCLGNTLVNKLLPANIYNSGISCDGKFAVCQTCNTKEVAGTLYFFDLSRGVILWEIQPEEGWADSYKFDTDNKNIYLIYGKNKKFAYDF